jgi:hypothetical protein
MPKRTLKAASGLNQGFITGNAMDISSADIKECQRLYMKHYGIKLSDKMARIKLSMLVRQMEIVYAPVTAKEVSQLRDLNEYDNAKLISTN